MRGAKTLICGGRRLGRIPGEKCQDAGIVRTFPPKPHRKLGVVTYLPFLGSLSPPHNIVFVNPEDMGRMHFAEGRLPLIPTATFPFSHIFTKQLSAADAFTSTKAYTWRRSMLNVDAITSLTLSFSQSSDQRIFRATPLRPTQDV